MARNMIVDFYTVQTASGAPAFEVPLRDIGRSPQNEGRSLSFGNGQFVRLQTYAQRRNVVEVDMLRIRMDEMPKKVTLTGEVEGLGLEDDEGLGEETAFLYDPSTCLLALQRNRDSVSASALTYYVSEMAQVTRPYVLLPVIDPNVMARVEKLKDVRRFRMRVTGSQSGSVLGEAAQSYGFTRVNHVMDNFQAPSIEVTLSMGRGRRTGSLNVEKVKGFVNRLRGVIEAPGSPIEKIEINGHDEDGATALIDLLKYRVFEQIRLTWEEGRSVGYEARRNAIRQALRNRTEDLDRILGRS